MIRAFRSTDTQNILDIWYEASLLAHPFLKPEFLEKEKRNIVEIYLPNTKTWVFLDNEEPCGFISMIENEVGAIFLKPKFHGQGIGKKLMDHVRDLHDELLVDVFEENSIGRAFYSRYGFTYLDKYLHQETGQSMLKLRYKR